MILKCEDEDFNEIYSIINDAAIAYKGIIPEDRWHEPYMSIEELKRQINEGVQFWKYVDDKEILGIMGSSLNQMLLYSVMHMYEQHKEIKV